MIIFIVTFILFFIEAIIHYNYGHKEEKIPISRQRFFNKDYLYCRRSKNPDKSL
jgi:hypothetical protein